MLIDIHHHYIPQQFIDLVRDDPERWQAVVYRDEGTGLDALVTGRTTPALSQREREQKWDSRITK